MGLPVVTVASGGLPVGDNTAKGVGMAVTEATYGIAVTKVASGGLGVVYVSATGGAAFTATTWNPADKSAAITLSNGNLTIASSSTNTGVRALRGQSNGKYYFEFSYTTISGSIGLAQATAAFNSTINAAVVGPGSGWIQVNGASVINIGGLATPVAIAVDLGAKRIWFKAVGGNWNGNASYDPAANTGGVDISAITSVPLYPIAEGLGAGDGGTVNFGASAFSGTVPSGFTGWPA